MLQKGQLKDILNIKNLEEQGFKLNENQIFEKEGLQEEKVKLSYQSGALRLFLYPKDSNFAYSIGVDNNENDLVIRKINLANGEEMKLEKSDKNKIMSLALNSKQLQELGLDRGLENENERGFFQKALDYAAQKIAQNPITTKLLLGFLASAATAPLTGVGAIAVGALTGFGAEGFTAAAQARHGDTLARKNSSILGQVRQEMEREQHPEEPSLNSSRTQPPMEASINYHHHHLNDVLATHPEIAARHNSQHLDEQMAERQKAATDFSRG